LEETLKRIPTIEPKGLRGGTIYYDGQFDDARLAINMAQTVVDLGGTVANYMKVVGLSKSNNMVQGVVVQDQEGGKDYTLSANVVINATGVFSDAVRKMDDAEAKSMVQPSQGVHIVLDQSFLPGDSAIMVPQTDDGRVLFAIPWHKRIVVGTTDTPLDKPELEPRAKEEELDFLLEHSQRYLTKDPTADDVLSTFAGLRPLVRNPEAENTAEISRDHTIQISRSGLVTIAGGKWTTYRKMGEDVIDQAATIAGLPERQSKTKDLPIHGWHAYSSKFGDLDYFGADAPAVKTLMKEQKGWEELLHPNLPYQKGEVIWAVREEMARTVEDVLSRRTRALLLDAKASMKIAAEVAGMMAKELGQDADWEKDQLDTYLKLAQGYLV
ncbi:MAG: glycerol-3-phosphate dehydrogenase/oxidase, partial [Rhodothermales bacterium]